MPIGQYKVSNKWPHILEKPLWSDYDVVRCATLVVAANDSSAKSKAQADYVCDGVADNAEIQAAIDALPAGGGKIMLLEGTFLGRFAIDNEDNITLAGQGLNTILKLPNGTDEPAQVLTVVGDNNIVRDFTIDGNKDNQTIADYTRCRESDGIGIYGDYNLIENIYVYDTMSHGIIVWGQGTAVQEGYNATASDAVRLHNTIKNCTISNVGISDNERSSLDSFNSDYTLFVNNCILGGTYTSVGITMHTGNHCSILGNIIKGNYTIAGINPHTTVRHIIVSDNNIDIDASYSISFTVDVEDINIISNSIFGNNAGINIRQTTRVSVANNNIKVDRKGILIYGSNTNFCIEGNTINITEAISEYGIRISLSSNDGIIIGNIIHAPNTYGIILEGATNVRASDNYVSANIAFSIDNDSDVIVYDQYSDHFQDCVALSTNYVHAGIVGTGAEQEIVANITNPDVPRNISVTVTNNAAPSGDVTITGVDAKGNSTTEDITLVPGGNAYGDIAIATVSMITVPDTVAGADTVTVGISDKLGLSNIIYETGDVYKVKVNNVDRTGEFNMAADVDVTNDTIDMSSLAAGTIAVGDDITVHFRSNLNIIS